MKVSGRLSWRLGGEDICGIVIPFVFGLVRRVGYVLVFLFEAWSMDIA